MMKGTLALLTALLAATPASAGNIVLSVEGGMAFMGDSGLTSAGPLDRHEVATTTAKGFSVGYQAEAWGGRVRGLFGYELLSADGDWGKMDGGDLARQTVDIQSTSYILGAEYDIKQVEIGALYPFVGGGVRFVDNRSAIATDIRFHDGTEAGCVGDDPDTWTFGWHALAGLGTDFKHITIRVFYQYTDRGYAEVDGDGCPSWRGKSLSPGRFNISDHSIRMRVSVTL